jgi:hypothetical protein
MPSSLSTATTAANAAIATTAATAAGVINRLAIGHCLRKRQQQQHQRENIYKSSQLELVQLIYSI